MLDRVLNMCLIISPFLQRLPIRKQKKLAQKHIRIMFTASNFQTIILECIILPPRLLKDQLTYFFGIWNFRSLFLSILVLTSILVDTCFTLGTIVFQKIQLRIFSVIGIFEWNISKNWKYCASSFSIN